MTKIKIQIYESPDVKRVQTNSLKKWCDNESYDKYIFSLVKIRKPWPVWLYIIICIYLWPLVLIILIPHKLFELIFKEQTFKYKMLGPKLCFKTTHVATQFERRNL